MPLMVLPAPVVPMDEVSLIDEAAIALGGDLARLMENAGIALAREATRLAPSGRIVILCGPGNNGGDGYVCARVLHQQGRQVGVWAVTAPASPLCRQQADALPAGVTPLTDVPDDAALVIDAMLGAGTHGEPREPIAGAIRRLRAARLPVLAADVPSGLGSSLVAPAVLTVCFQAAKGELLGQPGLGEFKTVDIGIPPAAWMEVQPACLRRFPRHKRHGHKGHHGELLVVGGGAFPGALEFACRAGMMSGCDMVRAWTAEGPPLPPTIVVHRQEGPHLYRAAPEELTPLLVRAGAVLIGCGMGRSGGAHDAAHQAFSLAIDMGIPVIVDADALAILAEAIRDLKPGDHQLLLTPHRSEARNLIGSSDDETIHAFARRDRVVLAKAPVDLITDGRRWQRNPRGNPRMAMGGTGDVLAGLAAGLMARGNTAFDAARMAVMWECIAADELWQEQGPCYDTLQLLAHLPVTLRRLMEPLGLWPPVTD